MKLIIPYESGTVRVTSPYGTRTLNGVQQMHKGIDLVGTDKTIVAPCDGIVGSSAMVDRATDRGRTWEWGNYIRIDTTDGYSVFLCHLSKRLVTAGQRVKAGDVIGKEGSTGYSTGSHLHLEVRYAGKSTDPTAYMSIANRTGSYAVKEKSYADKVCEKCGFENQTREYLDKYKYAEDLWRKLWKAME